MGMNEIARGGGYIICLKEKKEKINREMNKTSDGVWHTTTKGIRKKTKNNKGPESLVNFRAVCVTVCMYIRIRGMMRNNRKRA